jgi:hypothetical protein
LNKLGVPNIVARVEQVYSRKADEWLAGDIASIYAELSAVDDGFSSIDETWPLPAPPEPTRRDDTSAAGSLPKENPPGNGGPASGPTSPPVSPPAETAKGGAADAGLSEHDTEE